MKAGKRLWTAMRFGYGLFFLLSGIAILLSVATGWPGAPAQPTPEAQAFTDALAASGFVDPLLGAVCAAGGASLLIDRTAPLGIVLLAPPVAIILFFHLTLSGQYIWGPAVAAGLAALAWRYRLRLSALWSADSHVERR